LPIAAKIPFVSIQAEVVEQTMLPVSAQNELKFALKSTPPFVVAMEKRIQVNALRKGQEFQLHQRVSVASLASRSL